MGLIKVLSILHKINFETDQNIKMWESFFRFRSEFVFIIEIIAQTLNISSKLMVQNGRSKTDGPKLTVQTLNFKVNDTKKSK